MDTGIPLLQEGLLPVLSWLFTQLEFQIVLVSGSLKVKNFISCPSVQSTLQTQQEFTYELEMQI